MIYWLHSEKKIAYLRSITTELIMKFAIFGNTYQAKKSSHAENPVSYTHLKPAAPLLSAYAWIDTDWYGGYRTDGA